MSNAPLLDILAETSNEADYQAVYAELMASDRGRSFLTEFASRNLQPDTRKLVAMIARLGAARHNDRPAISEAVSRSLADLAAAIEEGEAALANCTRAPDETSIAECVRDIALAMRARKVEPVLCDALDAVAREVADSAVRVNAAVLAA